MRHVILGTAGHIDHGKSSLVQALTGVNPDRLKEERERGITIDLGFAEMAFDDGTRLGIVDVPGHERLVKNMLAGAGGIDMVLLVIAADEGIMPQSREHMNICNLLRIKTGLVAITKTDLVEPEWVDLVADEVRGFVEGTFLEGAAIVPISSRTGAGIPELKAAIHEVARTVSIKPSKGLFRLPVDRVFTMKGFGTVVTGTVVSGSVDVDEQVEVLPSQLRTKVRGLHSHGSTVKAIQAGQRAAINLQSVEKEELRRGDTVVTAGRFTPTRALDVTVEVLPSAPELKNRAQIHFHLGTAECVGRVVVYGADKVEPGAQAYCQVRLNEPVVAQAGDRFIIRRFSPVETIGGGQVLDPTPPRRKRREGVADLEVYERGTLEERIAVKVRKTGSEGMTRAALEGWVNAEVPAVRDAVGALKGRGEIFKLEDVLVHREGFARFERALTGLLSAYHEANPMKRGMQKEEARVRLHVPYKTFHSLLEMVPGVLMDKDAIALRSFSAALSDEDKDAILKALGEAGFQPPTKAELAAALKAAEAQVSDILKLMHSEEMVVRINDSMYMAREAYDRMIGVLKAHYAKSEDMTVAEFRDLLGTTRKYALPLLEHLDSSRMTLRVGDVRKWLPK